LSPCARTGDEVALRATMTDESYALAPALTGVRQLALEEAQALLRVLDRREEL